MLNSEVLVLNRIFQAIQVTTVRKAFSLLYKGQVRAVLEDYSTYDFENWKDVPVQPREPLITTPTLRLKIPRVILLLNFDQLPRQDIKFSRSNIYLRDGKRCQYCLQHFPTSELSLDHVVPLSRGGRSTWDNVVCACLRCNVRKGNRLPEEAGMKLAKLAAKPRWHALSRKHQFQAYHETWKNFLDVAYWNVELS